MRGKAEPASHQRRLDLGLGKGRDQRTAFQSFFQGPGGIPGIACLHQQKKRGVEAEHEEARSIRTSPFPCGLFGEAPQHEIPARDPLGRVLGDQGQGETERRRALAVGFGPKAMKAAALQLVQKPGWGWESDGTWKEAGRVGRGRARCGGDGQRHGNLLKRADLLA